MILTTVASLLHRWLIYGLLLLTPIQLQADEPSASPEINAARSESSAALITARLLINRETGPVHPFIYGQLLEHFGQGIQGGIWAELLVDRKFFHPPEAPESPWRKHGGETGWSLLHDPERPFAGTAAVKISVTPRAPDTIHGIQQAALGLIADREYIGHVHVAGRGTLKVRLQWGDRPSQSDTATIRLNQQNYGRYPFHFRPGTTTTNGILTVGVESSGNIWIGAASLMPADHMQGLRSDTLELLRELNAPIYRWPGGNFINTYDWRDGLGPRDRRPPRRHPDQSGIEPNDFGVDEFIAFCRSLETEPLVAVNTGLGSPELAAALVQYCNGSAQTLWGRRRATNGHPQPYAVRWWAVGSGITSPAQPGHIPIESYVLRHREFVQAMRAVDPEIRIIGVGASGPWSDGMISHAATDIDLLGETLFCAERENLEAHIAAIPEAIGAKVTAHRRSLSTLGTLKMPTIPLAFNAWSYNYGPSLYGHLGVPYSLRDALGVARGLHELIRNNDLVQLAHHACAVNQLGAVKTTPLAAAMDATGLPLMLYRRHFGTIAVQVAGDAAPLDIAAALSADRRNVTLAIVNPTTRDASLKVEFAGGRLQSQATRHLITASDPMAHSGPGQNPVSQVHETVISHFDPELIPIPALSISLYAIPFER